MNKLTGKPSAVWTNLVNAALTSLEGLPPLVSGRQELSYRPPQIDSSGYQVTPPVATAAEDPGRLVVRFTVTDVEGPREFKVEAIVVFDGSLALVPRETRKVLSANNETSPFFTAALIPRPIAGVAPVIVNGLAIAALGVGLLAAVIQSRRSGTGEDNDVSLRLLPHYVNLLIGQVDLAIRVMAVGGDLARIQRVTGQAGAIKTHLDGWGTAAGWTAQGGRAFEQARGAETIRLWRPTIATFGSRYILVVKFDRVIPQGSDDHVVMTLVFRPNHSLSSVVGDVFLTSNNTIFSIEESSNDAQENVLAPWITQARKQSVEAGLDGLGFVTGVGEILTGLVAHLRTQPVPKSTAALETDD